MSEAEKLAICCKTCRHFDPRLPISVRWGMCRRFPRVDADSYRVHADNDWCGEHAFPRPPVLVCSVCGSDDYSRSHHNHE